MERLSIAGAAPARLTPRPNGRRRTERVPTSASGVALTAAVIAAAGLGFPAAAHASFLPPEMMDKAAMGLAWFIIVFVPIGGIVLFWLVHILPEKIAHKRHHPQRDAIQTLCLLSLVFGGLLWPIAWLWAYTKPAAYRLAYGTEKHEDYYHELGEKAQAGDLLEHELVHLRAELDAMDAKGSLTAELKALRRNLAAVTPAPDGVATPPGGNAASATGGKA
jgi:CBS domain containing-hemolysin-like protein